MQSDEICFVQHTDLQINHGSSIFHRDNANRKFMSGPDWYEEKEKYGVVRIGLYLSSHAETGTSLIIIPNSHKNELIR